MNPSDVVDVVFCDNSLNRIELEQMARHYPSWGTRIAVSYTHLRAHETVLDLVCRLLLEKKKKSNISHAYST